MARKNSQNKLRMDSKRYLMSFKVGTPAIKQNLIAGVEGDTE